jgi:hypothetical protein
MYWPIHMAAQQIWQPHAIIPVRLSTTTATQYPAITAAPATRQDITLIMIGGQVRPHLGAAVAALLSALDGKEELDKF